MLQIFTFIQWHFNIPIVLIVKLKVNLDLLWNSEEDQIQLSIFQNLNFDVSEYILQ